MTHELCHTIGFGHENQRPPEALNIMHYPSYANTKRSDLKSMTARDGTDLSDERLVLTATDSLKIRTYYGCR
ncbi:hypothetical protein B4U80_15019 [Leptotrombidium deliense]|uniref:Metalloendopeptidase n=1 Tax=Leptotrombidium deliense TaxID=299467 RepID=A0A443RT51_9ACAR|nr:hypothetical protein B4U80_15019 [Leptotrombidium deliense]